MFAERSQFQPVAGFARDLQEAEDEHSRLQRGVEAAVELVEGCDHAGVSMVVGNRIQTEAATDDVVWRGDTLQYELDEGPCLDSVRLEQTVLSPDLSTDRRWPRWGPAAYAELDVRAMLSVLLFTTGRSLGALNLYSRRVAGFDSDDIDLAHALAAHLAVALADARELQHREVALRNRTVIGQAEGILMERLGVDAEQAFAYLRRVSSTTNVKLATVAAELVRTRHLPKLPQH